MFKSPYSLWLVPLPMFLAYILNEILWRIFDVYERIPWIDLCMHFVGGFVSAWSVALLLAYMLAHIAYAHKLQNKKYVIIFWGTFVIAVLWEVYEYVHDFFSIYTFQNGWSDALSDIMFGLIGAIVYIFLYKNFTNKKGSK